MPDALLAVYRRASRLKAFLQNARNGALLIPHSLFPALSHQARPPNSPVTVLT